MIFRTLLAKRLLHSTTRKMRKILTISESTAESKGSAMK